MARTFLAASSRFGSLTLPASYTYPFSMACRFSPAALGTQIFLCLNTGGTLAEVFIYTSNLYHIGTTNYVTASSITAVIGTQVNIVAVFTSATVRDLYIDGVLRASGGTSDNVTGQTFTVGKQGSGTAYYSSGDIQDAAFWSRALTVGEALAYHRGCVPSLMPYLLRAYIPMVGNSSPEPNLCGAAMTLSGSPPKALHKPTILPT